MTARPVPANVERNGDRITVTVFDIEGRPGLFYTLRVDIDQLPGVVAPGPGVVATSITKDDVPRP